MNEWQKKYVAAIAERDAYKAELDIIAKMVSYQDCMSWPITTQISNKIQAIEQQRDEARSIAADLANAFKFPRISFGNVGAMAYHLMQGKDNAGLTREALSAWLESINVQGKVYGQSQIEYHQAAARWQEEGKV